MTCYKDMYGLIDVDTIFLGGGTPNVLSKQAFEQILVGINDNFNILSNIEFTMEMNPGLHSKSKLNFFKSMGVNRVSVGIQSFHSNVLEDYGRNHTVDESLLFLKDVSESGFHNVSIDIIFGHPNHTKDDLLVSLNQIDTLDITHLALYGLTIEKNTPFHEANLLVNDDDQYEKYVLIQDYLNEKKFFQYEVSNFSKPGFESLHNIKYWTLQPTIGLGAGAHSYFFGHRYQNDLNYMTYLSSVPHKLPSIYSNTDWNDYISVRLRYAKPLLFSEIFEVFNFDFKKKYIDLLNKWNHSGFITLSRDQFVVSQKGFPILDELICYLLD